ncbi:AAA family ATPase [Natrinema sp. 1APR25-10V2]|uniref:AAA family ATPase n=1 Tax=Natrinema sp. 1APR25-10V2 TaxID=2951081 RepID=UPI002876C544|nr:AAA family ATPase [Natrinema sp. 1APR25-10V2]MDS0474593.1 AAA family ATPase [Natrinema sp. 1APR25-10V2]
MTDDRRMSTARFYGDLDDRADILAELLSFLEAGSEDSQGVPRDNVIDWIVSKTNAENPDAIERRLQFLEQLDLIESENNAYSCTRIGRCYFEEQDPVILYNALRTTVKGFDTILAALSAEPKTDEDLMEVLVETFEECQMQTPGVASRHREWLQMAGYVDRTDDQNHLTAAGETVAEQLHGVSTVELESDAVYERRELHAKYGGSIQGGIAPSRDEPVVFLFSGGTGEDHGYQDELRSDGTVVYTGEGQVGDMEMVRGNRAIRDHLEDGRELHFFVMEDGGVRYIGQYLYAGHFYEELPDSEGNTRSAIRFLLAPIRDEELPAGHTTRDSADSSSIQTGANSNLQQFADPSVYQVPIKTGDGPIRTNFERTILEDVPRDQISDIHELPIDETGLRVWGNQEDEPADEGDYLLFADREGRHGGSYTLLARIASATVLDDDAAAQFTDAVGWGDVTDQIFPHIMFLQPIYEAELDREQFWELLGFKGWPNDTFSAINFDRRGSQFYDEYESVNQFIEEIQGEQLYPGETAGEYESLDATLEDIRNRLFDENKTWFQTRIGDSFIEEWSEALEGFRPGDTVPPSTAAKFAQLQTVYRTLEADLADKATELGTGTLDSLSAAQTLLLGWIRLRQNELESAGGMLNQPQFNSILNDAYEVADPDHDQPADEPDHPLTTHLQEAEPTVYKFTAPPDYWLTAIEYRSLSFEPEHRNRWEQLEKGDVGILHSRAEPGNEEYGSQPSGVIGAVIFGETTEKSEPWWWEELEGGADFSMIASFDRLFLTSDIDAIDFSQGITAKETTQVDQELTALTANCVSIEKANQLCAGVSGKEFPAQSMYGTFRADDGAVDYERPTVLIEAMANDLRDVSPINPHQPLECTLPADILEELHFEDGRGEQILEQIATALQSGKHVLLTGPPGTGKTEIAERVCEYLVEQRPSLYTDFEMTTATADWSTFDTVGGYMPNESGDNGGDLTFTPGIVLNRLKDIETGTQSNELIVIDELNRADIDKAFGQLFTLLSGQSVQLPYTIEGREVELTSYDEVVGAAEVHQYVVPNSWRIFATMNAYDKTSLYEMSYAFMRRFAFVRVPAPDLPDGTDGERTVEDVVLEYAETWDLEVSRPKAWAVGRVWQATNQAVDERAIGPAIIEDVLRYVNHHPEADLEYHLTQAVISYIFPQLEGVPKREKIVRKLAAVDETEAELLEAAAREMLQVTLATNE